MTEVRKGTNAYYDDKHFPMGFSRSGDFTIPESKLLTDYGFTLKQLSDGRLNAETELEHQFLQVIAGQVEAKSPIEKVWLKYLKVTAPQKYISIYGSAKPEVDNDQIEEL